MTATPPAELGATTSVRSATPMTSLTEKLIVTAAVLGAALSVVGIAVGLSMAFHRRLVECENGHYFPEGTTDFRCFSYPHAGDGVAVAVLTAMLGIVIGLCCALCHRLVVRPHSTFNAECER